MSRPNIKEKKLISASRIDFIYLPSSLIPLIHSNITEYTPVSDHKLVICNLAAPSTPRNYSWRKLLPTFQKNKIFKECINKSLNSLDFSSPNQVYNTWENFKQTIISTSIPYSNKIKTHILSKINKQKRIIKHLENNTPLIGPHDQWLDKWSQTYETLNQLIKTNFNSHYIIETYKWIKNGDKTTKYFLTKFNVRKSQG